MKRKTSDLESKLKTSRLSHILNTFPRLAHVLENIPESVGLNIEIKYPNENYNSHLRDLPEFEMNSYLDIILKTVFDFGGGRPIIFSSFDPDVCVMLRWKQAKYPIYFLTCAGTYDSDYDDTRCHGIHDAIMFAQMERLQGIVCNAGPLLQNLDLIKTVKSAGLVLFTWGDENNDYKNVQIQKLHGVDAVISDNIGDLSILDGKI